MGLGQENFSFPAPPFLGEFLSNFIPHPLNNLFSGDLAKEKKKRFLQFGINSKPHKAVLIELTSVALADCRGDMGKLQNIWNLCFIYCFFPPLNHQIIVQEKGQKTKKRERERENMNTTTTIKITQCP